MWKHVGLMLKARVRTVPWHACPCGREASPHTACLPAFPLQDNFYGVDLNPLHDQAQASYFSQVGCAHAKPEPVLFASKGSLGSVSIELVSINAVG